MTAATTGPPLVTILLFLGATSCGAAPLPPAPSALAAFHPAARAGIVSGCYVSDTTVPADRWVLLLPGASGLRIFDDEGHYFRAATALARQGFAAIVVDYKRAYHAADHPPDGATGAKIAWVVEQCIQWARANGVVRGDAPGALLVWSLGAEGLWDLCADPARLAAAGVHAAAAYYPANEDQRPITAPIPLLVFAGEADDVTPAADLRHALASTDPRRTEVHFYPGAHHGFDIASLTTPRTISLLPLIGPSATFGYDPVAADDAARHLAQFFAKWLPAGR